jgi:hypothetical protein
MATCWCAALAAGLVLAVRAGEFKAANTGPSLSAPGSPGGGDRRSLVASQLLLETAMTCERLPSDASADKAFQIAPQAAIKFGTTPYTSLWLNTAGLITFGAAAGPFTLGGASLSAVRQPAIAAYFGDSFFACANNRGTFT